MDTAFLPSTLSLWLTQYGSFALFVLLALGIFALPIPDETLMVLAGILMAREKLLIFPTYIAAIMGAIAGITVSYVIGRTAGALVIRRYGHWVGITETRMQYVNNWFERFGRWALFIGYFIPGVRHLTGYAAGITEMEYRHFAVFSYTGGILWACIFLSIGYFLGDRWEQIQSLLADYWIYLAVAAVILIAVGSFFIRWRNKRKEKKP
jgi:membrane protein DedA with SNARE-associated domain